MEVRSSCRLAALGHRNTVAKIPTWGCASKRVIAELLGYRANVVELTATCLCVSLLSVPHALWLAVPVVLVFAHTWIRCRDEAGVLFRTSLCAIEWRFVVTSRFLYTANANRVRLGDICEIPF